ncbi:MAG: alkaline phosphatase [Candidatus Hodarchaeales archaeon]
MKDSLLLKIVIRGITCIRQRKSLNFLIIGSCLVFFNVNLVFPSSSSGFSNFSETTKSEYDNVSIILMIGDGMGFEHVELAQWVEKGVNGTLNMQNLPIKGKVVTHNLANSITDSAASATAIATGYKAYNGIISRSLAGVDLLTILELTQQINKSTGIITTTEITHATPAAFYAHTPSRDNGYEIGQQLITSGIDTIMGGGKNLFASQLNKIQDQGYTILENRSELLTSTDNKIFGLFTGGAFPYEQDRDREMIPSLAEMTNKSIDILSQNPDGFFLLVEGGQIDWASHIANEVNAALETIEFDKAVKTAINYVETHNNTILIVTADHETGGLVVSSEMLTIPLPNENNTEDLNENIRINRTHEITLSWGAGGHTNANVPLFAYGNYLNPIANSTIDNTKFHLLMKNYLMPNDRGKPEISILSPVNQSYEKSNLIISLDTNESLPWIVYSLNSGPNVTIPTLTSYLNLADGNYFLKIYGNDTMNNTARAEVYFTINTTSEVTTKTTTEVIEDTSMSSTLTTTFTSSAIDTTTSARGFEIMGSLLFLSLLISRKKRGN